MKWNAWAMKWNAWAAAPITLLSAWALAACLSPTIPLPPPGEPTEATLSSDRQTVHIRGEGVFSGAIVLALNRDLSKGSLVFAASSGTYELDVPVDVSTQPTNVVQIWQRVGMNDSDTVTIHVPYKVGFGALPDSDAGTDSAAGTEASDDAADAGAVPSDADDGITGQDP